MAAPILFGAGPIGNQDLGSPSGAESHESRTGSPRFRNEVADYEPVPGVRGGPFGAGDQSTGAISAMSASSASTSAILVKLENI